MFHSTPPRMRGRLPYSVIISALMGCVPCVAPQRESGACRGSRDMQPCAYRPTALSCAVAPDSTYSLELLAYLYNEPQSGADMSFAPNPRGSEDVQTPLSPPLKHMQSGGGAPACPAVVSVCGGSCCGNEDGGHPACGDRQRK